jgi:hypothetical protein
MLKYEYPKSNKNTPMITQVMIQPSSWVESGIEISKVRNLNLFKFSFSLSTL